MKPGDIVISSPRKPYSPLLVGIIRRSISPFERIYIDPYYRDAFTCRPVTWLTVNTTKHSVSPHLAIRLENPHAIIRVDRPTYGEEVFSIAFRNYQASDSSKVDIECPRYRAKNPLETLPAQELITFFSALYFVFEQGRLDEIRGASFEEIISNYYDDEIIGALIPRVNSPLNFRLITRRPLLAAFIASGIALVTAGALNADVIANLSISNSAMPEQGYTDEDLHNLLKSTINAINPKTIKHANERGRKGQSELGLRTGASITNR